MYYSLSFWMLRFIWKLWVCWCGITNIASSCETSIPYRFWFGTQMLRFQASSRIKQTMCAWTLAATHDEEVEETVAVGCTLSNCWRLQYLKSEPADGSALIYIVPWLVWKSGWKKKSFSIGNSKYFTLLSKYCHWWKVCSQSDSIHLLFL